MSTQYYQKKLLVYRVDLLEILLSDQSEVKILILIFGLFAQKGTLTFQSLTKRALRVQTQTVLDARKMTKAYALVASRITD